MIKAFLFDYDGVITAGCGDGVPAARLSKNLGVSVEQAAQWIVSIWDGYSTGRLSDEAAWKDIEAKYGKPITAAQRDIWYDWEDLTPLPEMTALVQRLRAAGYPVGVVSNVIPPTAALIREHGGYDGFDFVLLSYKVGVRKPDAKMYEAALAKLGGLEPEEVVYLDDREPLTSAASKLGLQTIFVDDHAHAISMILALVGSSVGAIGLKL